MTPIGPAGARPPVLPTARPSTAGAAKDAKAAGPADSGFAGKVDAAMQHTEQALKTADQTVVDAVSGRADAHEVALALEQADLQMRMVVKVRNKVVEAYQELMRMPV